MSLSEVAEAVCGRLLGGRGRTMIKGVSSDSRQIEAGDLFVALRGPNHDGHDYVDAALSAGAAAAMVEREAAVPEGKAAVVVEDSLRALGDLAGRYRRKLRNLKAVGITGSNGKTTTKDMMTHLLRSVGSVVSAEKSFNNFIGVPLTVFKADARDLYAVFELGTSARGEISRLARICQPGVGVITSVSRTHLEGLGSEEEVGRAKGELLEALPADGTAVLNADNRWCRDLARSFGGSVLTFGLGEGADVKGKIIEATEGEIRFAVIGFGEARLRMFGRWNVYNALAALAACKALGLDVAGLLGELESFRPQSMRMEVMKIAGVKLINDAYNANPESVGAAVRELRWLAGPGKAVLVLGDMLELGEESERLHREVGELIAAEGIDELIGVGEKVAAACQAAAERGVEAACFEDWNQALARLEETAKPGCTVLVKGSRGMRLERIVEGLKSNRSVN